MRLPKMNKAKKIVLVFLVCFAVFVFVVVLFISPLTKYLIEKYDEKYTGRQIKMDWVYVNPFTGYVHFSHLKIKEHRSDTDFISISGLSVNFSMLGLLSKSLDVSNLTISQPKIIIVQANHQFNFDDIVNTFSPKGSPDSSAKPFHFSFRNIKINEGHFYYIDRVIPVNISIKNVNIISKDGWSWDKDTIAANIDFLSDKGNGKMKGNYKMNLKSLDYVIDLVIQQFDINSLQQYMKGFANYGTLKATIDADLKTHGSFKDAENITIKGQLAVNQLHFGKDSTEDYASFDQVVFNLNEVNPKQHKYYVDSVLVLHPYFKFEQYDHLNNIETMFGKKGANVSSANSNSEQFNLIFTIGKYIEKLAKNFLQSEYKVNKLEISKADLQYNDYSLNEKFSLSLNPLSILADSVYKNNERVNLSIQSGIKPYGNLSVNLSISPHNAGDFDLDYHLMKVPITLFNPFIIAYTSFPFDRGTIEFNGKWNVKAGEIKSNNHLLLLDPRISERLRNKDIKWIPVPLIMSFVRERGNVIDYDIPITGNLKNPDFHLRDVLFDLITNIFVKPSTKPYQMHVKTAENVIEKTLTLKWRVGQRDIGEHEAYFINKMAQFLAKNPEAFISVYPQQFIKKEKESILFFEAKKKYWLSIHNKKADSFTSSDSAIVDKMSVRDSNFVSYLDEHVHDTMLFTIQAKCAKLIDPVSLEAQYKKLNSEREKNFLSYFRENKTDQQVKFHLGEKVIPYNGFSFFKLVYSGELPKELQEAYQEMNRLNDEAPRKKFTKERKENRTAL